MTVDPHCHVARHRSALDHSVAIGLRQRLIRQPAGALFGGAEQDILGVAGDAGGVEIGVDSVLHGLKHWHDVFVATLLVQPHPSEFPR